MLRLTPMRLPHSPYNGSGHASRGGGGSIPDPSLNEQVLAPSRNRDQPNCGPNARPHGDDQIILYPIYFEKRSFSSSGSRVSLTQRRSAMTKGSRFRRTSKSATRRVRSSALAWQW